MTLSDQDPGFVLVDNSEHLQELIRSWIQLPCVAIDTEFMRSDTFFAKPGLIQIADGQGIFLIDPLKIENLTVFKTLLESPNVTKIIHSMSEDIDLLYHVTGARPSRIFDTQVAASFAGYGAGIGYQSLVKELLGLDVDKSETRSDWLQRPLSQKQLSYAASDVKNLLKIFHKLSAELQDKGLLEATLEECDYLVLQVLRQFDSPQWGYLKIKGGWDLSPTKQRLLQQLVIWRDRIAMDLDLPKGWVFSDPQLLEVSQKKIKNLAGLREIRSIKHKQIKRFGEPLLQVVRDYEPDENYEFKLIDRPLKGREQSLYKALKKVILEVEEQSGIAAALLGSRKLIEKQVLHLQGLNFVSLIEEFGGWRREWLEKDFSNVIEAYIAEV